MSNYYRYVNLDLLDRIPACAEHVLEIGVGEGYLGHAYLARNPSACYFGVELVPSVAREAACRLSHVIQGDIESPVVMNNIRETYGVQAIDALVFGDVLEHLRDPWTVLGDLRTFCSTDAVCIACVPNVSHWSLIQDLLAGRWNYTDAGLLDRTHLRFFTLESVVEMFQQAGWTVLDAKPRLQSQERTVAALKAFRPVAETLGINNETLQRNLSAFQWVIRAVNGNKPRSITIAALALKKKAGGVNEARIDHPLRTLSTLTSVRTIWSSDRLELPAARDPGVFILHRQFLNAPEFKQKIEDLIKYGWVVVSEIDDDPHHWRAFVESDFYAFRAVHAVTVSTEALAEMIRLWNPNVTVFNNAIFELPEFNATTHESQLLNKPTRIFFGAFNRRNDWLPLIGGIQRAAKELSDEVEWVVVHDQEFFDALPVHTPKIFFETLALKNYLDTLASCEVSLLPLANTRFNSFKSDLKLIESCAAGCVPICSRIVYGLEPVHADFALFATTSDDWYTAITTLVRNHDRRSAMAKLGREYVEAQRMHYHVARERETYYRNLVHSRDLLERQRRARIVGISVEGDS